MKKLKDIEKRIYYMDFYEDEKKFLNRRGQSTCEVVNDGLTASKKVEKSVWDW